MAYKIVWSPEAVKTFDGIVNYIAKNFTDKEVSSFINTVNRRLLVMSRFPKVSRILNPSKRRKAVIHKRTILFYKIRERKKEVELLSFFDTRRNNRWLKGN